MGRPKIDNAKSNKITIRLDNETLEKLKSLCDEYKTTQAELLRMALNDFWQKK